MLPRAFVKFGLLFARKYIREVIGKSIDLNAELADSGTSLRLHDVRIQAGDDVTVSARFS